MVSQAVQFTGLQAVELNLIFEDIKRVKLLLVAYFVVKGNADILSVDVLIEIEEMDFKLHAFAVDGGSPP